jgi:SAM-dependent methyltransferase
VTDTFYRTFSEKQLTGPAAQGGAHRARTHGAPAAVPAPSRPHARDRSGQGTLAALAVDAGWQYAAVEPSAILAEQLRARGLTVIEAFAPPLPAADAAYDVIYADQVLEHMSGIDAARALTAEARRALTPGGVFFVVVPDYLKERGFFWDIDYTHNFPTTERRVRQLLYDGGFEIERVVRSIGVATGVLRDGMAAWRCWRMSRDSMPCRATRTPRSCCSRCGKTCSRR